MLGANFWELYKKGVSLMAVCNYFNCFYAVVVRLVLWNIPVFSLRGCYSMYASYPCKDNNVIAWKIEKQLKGKDDIS